MELIKGNAPFKLPISVIQLTSYLQAKPLKEFSQKSISPQVQRVDVNKDGYISQQDLKAFQGLCQNRIVSSMDEEIVLNLFTRLR